MAYSPNNRSVRRNRYLETGPARRTAYPGRAGKEKITATPMVLLVQTALVLLILAAVFTMQFFEPEQYEKTGTCYQQIMAGEAVEDETLQTLSTPITVESIRTLMDGWTAEKILEVFRTQENTVAQGGQETAFPRNASFARVVVSAPARSPLPCDAEITSGYGVRTHPITGKWDFHTGIDLPAPEGTEIHAIYPGTVRKVGNSESYGLYLVVEHSEHLATIYCHCSRLVAAAGDAIKAGETIAEVGSTGISTGAHLHLSVLLDGYYIDPMNLYGQ